MGKKSRSGSGTNIPDHISERLETTFLGLKILTFFNADADPESFMTLDPGWKNSDTESATLFFIMNPDTTEPNLDPDF